MILVVGATGLLGFETCKQLRARGLDVVALVRNPVSARAAELVSLGVRLAAGDLVHPSSLHSACSGAATVVTTATATSRTGREDTIEAVDLYGQLALVRAAADAGVHRFVYVSAAPSPAACPFLRYKREVEAAVRRSGLAWTILQPTAFMDVWLSPAMGWDIRAGDARVIGAGEARTSYMAVKDVASFVVLAATRDELVGRTLVLGGPEALSASQVVALCERVTGRPFRVRRVPAIALRAASLLLRPFDTKMSSLLAMGACAAKRDDVIDMRPVLSEFPLQLTSVEEFVSEKAAGLPA